MVHELHEIIDVDLKKCRRRAKLLARERSDLRLSEALDLVAKEALEAHYEKNPISRPSGKWAEEDATFSWHDLMYFVWDIHPDGTLERTWTERGLPGGLTSRIKCPVLSADGVRPFLDDRGQPVSQFPDWLCSSNELRWLVTQEPYGDGVLQTLTINRAMQCLRGPGLACRKIPGRIGHCCERTELGHFSNQTWTARYQAVLRSGSRKAMAAWLLEEFAHHARAPIAAYDNEFAWLTTTPVAKSRMSKFRDVWERT